MILHAIRPEPGRTPLNRSLVELHHGTIIARNRTDVQGSEFIIRIPQGSDHLKMEELEQPDTTTSENNPTITTTTTSEQPVKTTEETETEKKNQIKKQLPHSDS